MKTPYEKVIEFNSQILGIDQEILQVLPREEALLLVRQLREEIEEFEVAHQRDNFVACVDSLIDLIYFALGGLYKKGLNSEDFHEVFAIVHECNMNKKKGTVEKRAVEGAADAIKPEGWKAPECLILEYFSGDYNV